MDPSLLSKRPSLGMEDYDCVRYRYLSKPNGMPQALAKPNQTEAEKKELLSGVTKSIFGQMIYLIPEDYLSIDLEQKIITLPVTKENMAILEDLSLDGFCPQWSLLKILQVRVFSAWLSCRSPQVDSSFLIEDLKEVYFQLVMYQRTGEAKYLKQVKEHAKNIHATINIFKFFKNDSIHEFLKYVCFWTDCFTKEPNILPHLLQVPYNVVRTIWFKQEKADNMSIRQSEVMDTLRRVCAGSSVIYLQILESIEKEMKNSFFKEKIEKHKVEIGEKFKTLNRLLAESKKFFLAMHADNLCTADLNFDQKIEERAAIVAKIKIAQSTLYEHLEALKLAHKELSEKLKGPTLEKYRYRLDLYMNGEVLNSVTMLLQMLSSPALSDITNTHAAFNRGVVSTIRSLPFSPLVTKFEFYMVHLTEQFKVLEETLLALDIAPDEKKSQRKALIWALKLIFHLFKESYVHFHFLKEDNEQSFDEVKMLVVELKKIFDHGTQLLQNHKELVDSINKNIQDFESLVNNFTEVEHYATWQHVSISNKLRSDEITEADEALLKRIRTVQIWMLTALDLDKAKASFEKIANDILVDDKELRDVYENLIQSYLIELNIYKKQLLLRSLKPFSTPADYQEWHKLSVEALNRVCSIYMKLEVLEKQTKLGFMERFLSKVDKEVASYLNFVMYFGVPLYSLAYTESLYHKAKSPSISPPKKVKKVMRKPPKASSSASPVKKEVSKCYIELPSQKRAVLEEVLSSNEVQLLHKIHDNVAIFTTLKHSRLVEIKHNLMNYLIVLTEAFEAPFSQELAHQKLSKSFLLLEQTLKAFVINNSPDTADALIHKHDINLLLDNAPLIDSKSLRKVISRWHSMIPVISRYPTNLHFTEVVCEKDALILLESALKLWTAMSPVKAPISQTLQVPTLCSLKNVHNIDLAPIVQNVKSLFDSVNVDFSLQFANGKNIQAYVYTSNIQFALEKLSTLCEKGDSSYTFAEQLVLHTSVLLEQYALYKLFMQPAKVKNKSILEKIVKTHTGERVWKHSHRIHEFLAALNVPFNEELVKEFSEFLSLTYHYPAAKHEGDLSYQLDKIQKWIDLKLYLKHNQGFMDPALFSKVKAILDPDPEKSIEKIDSYIKAEVEHLKEKVESILWLIVDTFEALEKN